VPWRLLQTNGGHEGPVFVQCAVMAPRTLPAPLPSELCVVPCTHAVRWFMAEVLPEHSLMLAEE
jgi:hypothetical protein